MSALDVLPVVTAKRFLNITRSDWDTELSQDFIPPAVDAIERWTGKGAGGLESGASPSELFAVKVVLREYWRTQYPERSGGSGAPTSYGAAATDTGPAGGAPLERRLETILGPKVASAGGGGAVARGTFDPPQPWPDPAVVPRTPGWPW